MLGQDYKRTVPSTSKGPVGKKLVGYQKLPVVNFLSIGCQIPYIGINVIYLLNISKAIKSETCKEYLVLRDPGPLLQKSWLTKANRTHRLCIREENTSPELKEKLLFTLKSHMPMWFTIKTYKHFTDGPKLVHQAIQSSRHL